MVLLWIYCLSVLLVQVFYGSEWTDSFRQWSDFFGCCLPNRNHWLMLSASSRQQTGSSVNPCWGVGVTGVLLRAVHWLAAQHLFWNEMSTMQMIKDAYWTPASQYIYIYFFVTFMRNLQDTYKKRPLDVSLRCVWTLWVITLQLLRFKDKLQTVGEVGRDREVTNRTFRDGCPDPWRSDFKTCLCVFDCARGQRLPWLLSLSPATKSFSLNSEFSAWC